MSRNAVETVMGAVVLVVAALFLFFAYTRTQTHPITGYDVSARFDRVDGLRTGGDVRISGIKVGTVTSQSLDQQTFLAVVHLTIDPSIKLPVDTIATITSTPIRKRTSILQHNMAFGVATRAGFSHEKTIVLALMPSKTFLNSPSSYS